MSLTDAKTKELRAKLDDKGARLSELHRIAEAVYGDRERMNRADLRNGLRLQIPRKIGQTDDAYDKVIQRTIKEMLDVYNVLTVIGEPKNSFKYLREIDPLTTAPTMSLFAA